MRNRVPILLTGLICLAAGYFLNSPRTSAQGAITSIAAGKINSPLTACGA